MTAKCDYVLYFEDVNAFEELPKSIQEHLEKHKAVLSNRATVLHEGRTWWKYSRPMHKELYHLPKLYCSRRAFHNTFYFDSGFDYLGFSNMTVIFENNPDVSIKYVLALLNSKLLNFRYKSIGKQTGGGSFEYFPNGVGKMPIPQISLDEQQPFIAFADKMLSLHAELRRERERFQQLLFDNLGAVKMDDKRFDGLMEFKDFLVDVKKQKCPIPLGEQDEWRTVFTSTKQKIAALGKTIKDTDAAIDWMVYALYGLTEDEIAVVEVK
jgi:hypothetical protein